MPSSNTHSPQTSHRPQPHTPSSPALNRHHSIRVFPFTAFDGDFGGRCAVDGVRGREVAVLSASLTPCGFASRVRVLAFVRLLSRPYTYTSRYTSQDVFSFLTILLPLLFFFLFPAASHLTHISTVWLVLSYTCTSRSRSHIPHFPHPPSLSHTHTHTFFLGCLFPLLKMLAFAA